MDSATTHIETENNKPVLSDSRRVPALRFNEFEKGWISKNIEHIASKVTSGSRDWAQYYSDSGDKFIRMTNLPKKGIYLLLDDLKYVKLPEKSSEGKRTSLDSGDILISITAELGKIGWVPEDLGLAYINQHTALIKLTTIVDSKYVAYQLSTNRNNKKINRLNDSGAKSGLNLSTIRSFSIPFPTLPEQQKIASFLSAVDDKVQQLTKKAALLEDYKKGVMQQLFSGQLRFKAEDGKDYPEWKRGRFSKFIKLYRGSSPRPIVKYVTTDESGVNWIKIGDTKQSENYRISSVSEKITREGSLKSRFVEKGEIILANSMSFGKSYLLEVSGCIYDGWFVLREYEESFDKEFMLQVLNSDLLQRQYLRLSTGGVVQNINSDIVYSTLLFCPVIEEQQKIATYLSSIDTKIEAVNTQITQTQAFKKGLLQQMFV
jgi:type I restriction enzyme S subunit